MKKVLFILLILVGLFFISGCTVENAIVENDSNEKYQQGCHKDMTQEECEQVSGEWVIPVACLAIGCPKPGPPYCECPTNSKETDCNVTDDCNLAVDEICVDKKCVKNSFICKEIVNYSPPKPGTLTCTAMPELWFNQETEECMYRGCGYSPYGSPGEGWIRIG